jgi:hypothetical protein
MSLKDPLARKKYRREYYEKNKERLNAYKKQWDKDNPEKVKEISQRNYQNHKEYHRVYNRKYGLGRPEEVRIRSRKHTQSRRIKVLTHYSYPIPTCACCGEKEIKFLCLDHINNDGAEHRRQISGGGSGRGAGVYAWSVKNNYPPIFQVLCYNCNCAKGFYGECPHKQLEKA